MHNFQQKKGKKPHHFSLRARSVTQESSSITIFYPLNELLSLQFQEFLKEKSQPDRLFQFAVKLLMSPNYRPSSYSYYFGAQL